MSQTFRNQEILEIARARGKVTVDHLADHFGVTLQTIRRDLSELADAGQLERVHGGAILPSATTNIAYAERRSLNQEAKRRIAARCTKDIPDGISLFLGIGTSTEAVAEMLCQHENMLIVTNNMNVARILTQNPSCEVVVTGGQQRATDEGLVGSLAVQCIERFRFDLAVFGCSALDVDGDLFDYDLQEVAVSETVLRQSRDSFLVADHTKFSRSAPARIASMAALSAVYTDEPMPGDLTTRCENWQTDVVIA